MGEQAVLTRGRGVVGKSARGPALPGFFDLSMVGIAGERSRSRGLYGWIQAALTTRLGDRRWGSEIAAPSGIRSLELRGREGLPTRTSRDAGASAAIWGLIFSLRKHPHEFPIVWRGVTGKAPRQNGRAATDHSGCLVALDVENGWRSD